MVVKRAAAISVGGTCCSGVKLGDGHNKDACEWKWLVP